MRPNPNLETGVTEPTVRKWLGRYLAEGEAGLVDRSSRPNYSPRRIKPEKALAIVELRRRRLTQACRQLGHIRQSGGTGLATRRAVAAA